MTTRERIIDAAISIVRQQGAVRLTLDEAARAADVSKGGVLYHFRNKQALLDGMIQRLIDQCDRVQARYCEELGPGPNGWAKAYLLASLDPAGPSSDPVGGALLAAVATDPALAKPVRDSYARNLAQLRQDSPDPDLAELVCLAMDGLWLQDMAGLRLFDEADRDRLRRRAMRLLEEGS